MNSFSYTVTSLSNIVNGVNVDDQANVVNIRFALPSKYRFFKCKIKSFVINTISITGNVDFLYLTSQNFASDGLYNSSNTGTQYIAICEGTTGMNNNVDNTFYVENPNGKLVTFTLVDDLAIPIPTNRINNTRDTIWKLTMEFTPLEDQQLKIGNFNNF